jgi:hypothetical protein
MAGCAETRIVDTGCQWTKDIIAHKDDTPGTKRQVINNNKMRKKKCGSV